MSKYMYKDYYGKRITFIEAFKAYKLMEVSFDYDITRLNLENIAKNQINNSANLKEFYDLLDELMHTFAHKVIKRKMNVKRWEHVQNIFIRMNDLIGLSEEEMKSKAVEFALDYENKEELMELGIKQIEIMNS